MITHFGELLFYMKADALMSRVSSETLVHRIFHKNYRKEWLRTLRIVEWLHNTWTRPLHKWKLIPLLYYSNKLDRLSVLCGFDIPLNVLGYGVNIAHYGSITMNTNTHIGNYCAIMNNVVIGDANPKHIGNGVLIGSNCVILKDVQISDGCQIAAMSLINKSCSERFTLWGGCPAKMIKDHVTYWYESDDVVKSIYLQCEALRKKYGIDLNEEN